LREEKKIEKDPGISEGCHINFKIKQMLCESHVNWNLGNLGCKLYGMF
jgi:hypothetical protein